jgi:hypothetical protein
MLLSDIHGFTMMEGAMLLLLCMTAMAADLVFLINMLPK